MVIFQFAMLVYQRARGYGRFTGTPGPDPNDQDVGAMLVLELLGGHLDQWGMAS